MQVPSYLAIQWIAIPYTDDQRGGKHASKRARMHGFLLPLSDNDDGLFHEVRCNIRLGLEPTAVTHAIAARTDDNLIRAGWFRLSCVERTLAFIGPNPWSSKPAFVVPFGSWGRVIWNDKDGDFGENKWLVEHIVNAGSFGAPPKRNVFRGLPAVERDMRRDFLRTGYAART